MRISSSYLSFFGLVCAFALSGCETEVKPVTGEEIRLASTISALTKGNVIEEQSELINSNQEVGVTIIGASSDHNNVRWVSDGLGELSNTGESVYYSGTSKAGIFAYHPYNSQWVDFMNQSYDFAVSQDQSGSGYANSDLLWAMATSDCNTPLVQLTFKHLLSKVNLYVADKDGKKVTASEIYVKNVEMTSVFSNGEVRSKEGACKGSVLAGMNTSQATAIIVPQTVSVEQPIVCAIVDGVEYNLTLSAPLHMSGGKSYTLNLTMQENGKLTLGGSKIDPWEDENVGGGNDKDDSDKETSGPQFSETVDLMALIARMAGTPGFTECNVPSISNSADAYFGPFRNHRAVQLMMEYRSTGVSYDAVTAYGNILSIDKNGRIVFDPYYKEGSSSSFDRWTQKQKYDMLEAVNAFYEESGFHEWFEGTKSLQEKAIDSFLSVCNLDNSWFDSYYGKTDRIASRIVLCFFLGGGNQGISYTKKDGAFFLTPTLGALRENGSSILFYGDMNLVVHEFSHPYCNPLIEKYWSSISEKADEIFSCVRSEMMNQAYSNSMTMMCETLVRTCAIRYMMTHGESNQVENQLNYEERNGFILVRSLVSALDERDNQATRYPTLDSFMPVLIDVINAFDVSSYVPTGDYEEYTNFANTVLLPGVFSVGPNRKVQFVRGNLYWDGEGWQLERNQMNFPVKWDRKHIGHFIWAKTAEDSIAYGLDTDNLAYDDRLFCDGSDEDHFLTIDGVSGLRLLSGGKDSEFVYLFRERKNAQDLIRYPVEVKGVGKCIVIAPDNYQGRIAGEYDAASWAIAENNGLVCFSPTGYRSGDVMVAQKQCNYWTASPCDESLYHAYDFGISGNTIWYYPSYGARFSGHPIRLAKDVTE